MCETAVSKRDWLAFEGGPLTTRLDRFAASLDYGAEGRIRHPMQKRLTIIGVNFTDLPFDEAGRLLSDATAGAGRKTVFFANAATLNLAARDPAYKRSLNAADLVFGDGTGVRWAARLRSVRLQANLNGTDVVPALIRSRPGLRVFMLGATAAVAEQAARRFPTLFPGAELVGRHHGYFDHSHPGDVIEQINSSRPDLLLVGFGNPLQEQFIIANRDALRVPLVAGVGGLFGFWAGTRTRASATLRRAGMEWIHILFTETGKKKRYLLGNPAFLMRMVLWLPVDCLPRKSV